MQPSAVLINEILNVLISLHPNDATAMHFVREF